MRLEHVKCPMCGGSGRFYITRAAVEAVRSANRIITSGHVRELDKVLREYPYRDDLAVWNICACVMCDNFGQVVAELETAYRLIVDESADRLAACLSLRTQVPQMFNRIRTDELPKSVADLYRTFG